MKTFTASFFGTCAACPQPVRVNQEIQFTTLGAVIHAQHVGPVPSPEEVCPWCGIKKPSSGDCCA